MPPRPPDGGVDPAWVALALTPGVGRARFHALLAACGNPRTVLETPLRDLKRVAGISTACATAIAERSEADGDRVLARAVELGAAVLTPDDPRFPPRLREIPDAPVLLFALGNLEQLARPAVALVGSRAHTRYGAEVCRHLAGGAARAGIVVASGMARGIDAIGHQAALAAGGGTVGVLGNGFGVVYPAANRALYDAVAADGCLLSEHPPGERPHAGSFPQRNRLISGLARAVVVVEARLRSGALLTAGCALEQGREVLAVPGPVTSPVSMGCNRLIQNGAKPALGIRDVLEEFGMTFADAPAASLPGDLSEAERRALDVVGADTMHVDAIAEGLGGTCAEALAVLTSLEIRGLMVQEAGKHFRRAAALTA